MGCWNGTDFLTQLPITAGDKMRLVFIHESPFFDNRDLASACYNTDMYRSIGIPLVGEYNDYGSIEELVPSLSHELLVEFFKKSAHEVPFDAERDKYVDRNSVDRNKISVDYLLERAQEGALYIDNEGTVKAATHQEKLGVGYVMIREDMYQAVINATTGDSWRRRELSKKVFHDGAKDYLESLKKFEADLKKPKEEESDILRKIKKTLDDLHFSMELDPRKESPFTMMLSPFYGISGPNFRDCSEFIRNKIRNGMSAEDPALVSFVYELADFMFFNTCLVAMRKAWQPQCGAGSQDAEYNLHAVLAKAVIKAQEADAKEREENEREWAKLAKPKVVQKVKKVVKKIKSKVNKVKKKVSSGSR